MNFKTFQATEILEIQKVPYALRKVPFGLRIDLRVAYFL